MSSSEVGMTFDISSLGENVSPDLLSHQVLRTDVSGLPLEWVNYQDAARLHHLGQSYV